MLTFTAGQKVPASSLQQLVALFARKTVDQTVNNSTTLVNDSDLVLAVTASHVYEMAMQLVYNSAVTPAFKWKWTFPTGLTMPNQGLFLYTGAYGGGTTAETTTNTASGFAGDLVLRQTGLVVVSSTAGNLQLQWAQNTANASNTVVRSGSYLRLTDVT